MNRKFLFLCAACLMIPALCLSMHGVQQAEFDRRLPDMPAFLPDGYKASPWERVVSHSPTDRRNIALDGRAACFAPDADEELVAWFSQKIFGNFSSPLDYIVADRWSNTASGSAGSQGDPIVLTYSYVPDGTIVNDYNPPNGYGDQPSDLFARMNSLFATEAQWKGLIAAALQWWGDQAGVTYIETVDDGASLYDPVTNSGHSPGVLGVRGDVRIAGCSFDGNSGVLAYDYYPDIADMVMDTDENWANSFSSYGFIKNVVCHEAGHGLGFAHVCPDGCTILMDPYLCTSIGGPQHDDLLACQRNYGDYNEPNNSSGAATDLGLLNNDDAFVLNVSSDDNSDVDWYSFDVPAGMQAQVLLDIVGESYLMCSQTQSCACGTSVNTRDDSNLDVYLYDSDASTLLGSGNTQPAGTDESISPVPLLGPATYYIQVVSDNSNVIQMYNLNVFVDPNTISTVTVSAPNGGETWTIGTNVPISWNSANVTGNVKIELNRDYPGGLWETLFASTADDGSETWFVSGAASINARVRISSINEPTATDVSNSSFTILFVDDPPVLTHEAHGDAETGPVTFVAEATDDNAVTSVKLFYRADEAVDYDSTSMTVTGNPDEYSASPSLAAGRYFYFIRALDALSQSDFTDTMMVDVGDCIDSLVADDGTAEGFNWTHEVEYEWAHKFDPGNYPYMLCGFKVAIARVSPDALHSEIKARVLDSDGTAGLPGTELWSELSGSIGNAIGGLSDTELHWATVWVDSGDGEALVLNAPFYLAVSNPTGGKYEAFGRDDDTPVGGASFFFEGCDLEWLSEDDAHTNAQHGTRMIRALGYSLGTPSGLVVIRGAGNDIELHWTGSGAPNYDVYSALTPEGPFGTLVGSTSDTTYTDSDAATANEIKFYQVVGTP